MKQSEYCGSQTHQLNFTLPALHRVVYVGSVALRLNIAYKLERVSFHNLSLNTTTTITHLTGTFQRNFVVNVTQKSVAISLSVRKFTGYTHLCKHGGIMMYHSVDMAADRQRQSYKAHVPYNHSEHHHYKKVKKSINYKPICTHNALLSLMSVNESMTLDIGSTYIVFYGYNSNFAIDLKLHVSASRYTAVTNIGISYCNHGVDIYLFKVFIVNCRIRTIQLIKQAPFTLQMLSSGFTIMVSKIYMDLHWPGMMNINLRYRSEALRLYSRGDECTSYFNLHITCLRKSNDVVLISNPRLNTMNTNQSWNEAESIKITQWNSCPTLDLLAYVISLDVAETDTRCVPSATDFTATTKEPYHSIRKRCAYVDAAFNKLGDHIMYLMEAYYKFPPSDNWSFYYISISDACVQRNSLIIYFSSITTKSRRIKFYNLTSQAQRSSMIFYEFGIVRILQLHVRRRSLGCSAHVAVTSLTNKQIDHIDHERHFKVFITLNDKILYSDILRV